MNHNSWIGNILDYSEDNYSLVANIQNLTTRYIYPQYHVVVDDMFHTVCGTGEYEVVTGSIWKNGFEQNIYLMLRNSLDNMVNWYTPPPPLDEAWLDEPEWRSFKKTQVIKHNINEDREN